MDKNNKKLFPQRLWELIHDDKFNFCLRWSPDGQRVYLNRNEFELHYLRTPNNQFHTQKAISFVRQMNMYGFRKVDDCYYENDNFKRNCHHLIKNMVRRHTSRACLFQSPTRNHQLHHQLTTSTPAAHNQHQHQQQQQQQQHQHQQHQQQQQQQHQQQQQQQQQQHHRNETESSSSGPVRELCAGSMSAPTQRGTKRAQNSSERRALSPQVSAPSSLMSSPPPVCSGGGLHRSTPGSTLYHRLATSNISQLGEDARVTGQHSALGYSHLSPIGPVLGSTPTPIAALGHIASKADQFGPAPGPSMLGEPSIAHRSLLEMTDQQLAAQQSLLHKNLFRPFLQVTGQQATIPAIQAMQGSCNLLACIQQQNTNLLFDSLANLSSTTSAAAQTQSPPPTTSTRTTLEPTSASATARTSWPLSSNQEQIMPLELVINSISRSLSESGVLDGNLSSFSRAPSNHSSILNQSSCSDQLEAANFNGMDCNDDCNDQADGDNDNEDNDDNAQVVAFSPHDDDSSERNRYALSSEDETFNRNFSHLGNSTSSSPNQNSLQQESDISENIALNLAKRPGKA